MPKRKQNQEKLIYTMFFVLFYKLDLKVVLEDLISYRRELNKLKALELIECNQLKNSYIQLKYKVIN